MISFFKEFFLFLKRKKNLKLETETIKVNEI